MGHKRRDHIRPCEAKPKQSSLTAGFIEKDRFWIASASPRKDKTGSYFLKYCCKTVISLAVIFLLPTPAQAVPTHSLTLWGEPKYSQGFAHFGYVNPDAPKGGVLKLAEPGTFDSLKPFILKGVKAPGLSLLYESLMAPSLDEPQSFYPWLAESVNVADDKRSVEFTMNPKARWHDGKPVTVADVIFTFHALKEQGDPTYALLYAPITEVKQTGERKVTFFFTDIENRELPFIAAQMPVLPKHYFDDAHPFDKTGLEAPIGSGAYTVESVDAGRAITYKRVEDWWAKDLPAMRGQYNFDRIRYDMYRDENVSLEAFKAGEYDFRREYISRNWATGYNSPALKAGKYVMEKIEHAIPQGMQAFVFNLRQPKFSDRRVREAIGLAMDFEWLNKTLFYNEYARNTSFFQNTPFEAKNTPDPAELTLLEPYKDNLPQALFTTPFHVPVTDGSGNARANLLKAQALLNDAGYIVRDGRRINPHTNQPMTIEFLLRQATMERVIGAMRQNLERLGITTTLRMVDSAQYQSRIEGFDYDIISLWLNNGVFFPGNEQTLLWHSSQADINGSNNIVGMKSAAVDQVLAALTGAKTYDELKAAGRALDRILLWEQVAIPHWHSTNFRIAYWNRFARPAVTPLYDIGLMTWWVK